MILKPIKPDIAEFPTELRGFLTGAVLYDSSCSPSAAVIFIDKDNGYFLKSAAKGQLFKEAAMMKFFHSKGLSSAVISYVSAEKDFLLTEKIVGDDCIAAKYLAKPEKLCDVLAERLSMLHDTDHAGCPVPDHTEKFIAEAERNFRAGFFNKDLFPDNWGYKSAAEAIGVIRGKGRLLQTDTLLHGDYCLPNIILKDWRFSGFIDLGAGGVGDRHVDIFWALWTFVFNLKTEKYRGRLIDAYGRTKVDEEKLRVVAAVEVFA